MNHNTFFRFTCARRISSDWLSCVVGTGGHFWTWTEKLGPLLLLVVSSSLLIVVLTVFGWHSTRNHLVFFLRASRSSVTLGTPVIFDFTAPRIIFGASSRSCVRRLLPTVILEDKLISHGRLEPISFNCSLVKDQISPSFSGSQR